MKAHNGRPIIEGSDSPQIIDEALRHSQGYWNQHMPEPRAFAWEKKISDATSTLSDAFGLIGDHILRPEGETVLHITPDDLELALVAYGCDLIGDKAPDEDEQVISPEVEDEIVAIDGLLASIDTIKQKSAK